MLDEILNHVGTLGWENCAWTEENLASKRLFPGHVFPAKNRKWQQRLRVSDRSLRIMVLRIHWEQEHQSCEKRSQKKPDDRACELLAEKAACLVSLADEFCSEHPITMETVQKKILDEWPRSYWRSPNPLPLRPTCLVSRLCWRNLFFVRRCLLPKRQGLFS